MQLMSNIFMWANGPITCELQDCMCHFNNMHDVLADSVSNPVNCNIVLRAQFFWTRQIIIFVLWHRLWRASCKSDNYYKSLKFIVWLSQMQNYIVYAPSDLEQTKQFEGHGRMVQTGTSLTQKISDSVCYYQKIDFCRYMLWYMCVSTWWNEGKINISMNVNELQTFIMIRGPS